MSINNISSNYNSVLSKLTNTAGTTQNSTDNDSSSSLTDSLDLSSASDLSAYLNYSSNGNYAGLSLADFLNTDSENNDSVFTDTSESGILNELSSSGDSANGIDSLYKDDSESIYSTFQSMADAKTKEIDDLISKKLSELSSAK